MAEAGSLDDGFSVEAETRLDAALADWQRLEAHATASPFQTTHSLRAWFAHVAAPGTGPAFVFIRRGDRLVAGLPLVLTREWLVVRRIGFADDRIGDYAVAMVDRRHDPQPDFGAIWPLIRAALPDADYAEFVKLPAVPMRPGADLTQLPGLQMLESSAHPVALPPAGADPVASLLSAKVRADLARRRKRLGERGAVGFVAAETGDHAAELFGRMVAFRSARFDAKGRRDVLREDGLRRYYRELCFNHPELALVTALTLDGRPIAIQYGFMDESRYYQIITAFADGPWTVNAPARLLMLDTMTWVAARGIEVYDFTYGDEPYKAAFGAEPLRLMRFAEAFTWRGRLVLAGKRLERRIAHMHNNYLAWRERRSTGS